MSATEGIEGLRATAKNGGQWFELGGEGDMMAGTVIVHRQDEFVALDIEFNVDDSGTSATFTTDISAAEETSPMSSAPVRGWVGWLNGDVVLAWQSSDMESQDCVSWPGRSPFDPDEDAVDQPEGFARIAAALECFLYDDEAGAFGYLPEGESEE